MTTIEINLERVSAGLPEAPVEVPASIMDALSSGRIKQSDLQGNMYAAIRAEHPVPDDLQPPLTLTEELARSRCIHAIATASLEHLI